MKILKRSVLALVLGVSLCLTTASAALADPVSVIAAVFVTALGEGAAIAVATFIVNTAIYAATSLGVGALTRALSGKNKAAIAERQASVTSLSLGEVPRAAVVGMACVGGSLVDVWNWGGQYGTDNVTRNIALADHAVEYLYGYYVDDVFYLYEGPGVQPGFNGTLTIDFRNGTADGHEPPAMAVSAGWEAGDRMTAVAHVWVTTRFDDKVWTQGHPKFRWVMHGLCAFDPRNGDVWEDRSTHSFTRNPALQRYAIARGIYAEGHQGEAAHLLIGRGLSAEEAPPERIIAAANLCDESVDGLSRYYADGEISADLDFIDVEQMFASAMAGVIIQHEGGVEVEPGQGKAAVVTIRDGDLVVGEPVSFSRFLPDGDSGRINTVVPRYVEPAQNYADHSGPVRRDLADIAKDGGPREMTLSMPLVTGSAVADRNAEIARRMARLEYRATIVLPPEYAWLEEGDWIAWQSDRRHDGGTVRYRIESWSLDEKWRMKLTLRQIASSVFGVPDPIEDRSLPAPAPVPVDALALGGVSAEGITLSGEASTLPAVRLRWDTPVDAAVSAIRAEVRLVGETDTAPTRTEEVAAGVMVVTNGVAAGAAMEARLIPIGDPSRPVLVSPWFTVSTVELVAGDVSPESPIWGQLNANTRGLLQNAIDDLHGLFDEEEGRDVISRDILDRLALGFEIDPVLRTALARTDLLFEGVGPGGLPETLVQTTLRLSAVDALNASATAQALIDAKAHTDAYKVEASILFATQAGLGSAISAARGEWQSYATAAAAGAIIGLATNAALEASIASARGEWRSYADASSASAVVGLVSGATLAGALATAQGQWESYATAAAASAIVGLVTAATLAASLATARGQWESYATAAAASAIIGLVTNASLDASIASARGEWQSYATAAAASAVIGLDTVAAREGALAVAKGQWESYATAAAASSIIGLVTGASLAGSLATAKGQWESYATAAAASATAGLDTVAAREGAISATVLALQSYTNSAVTTSAATLATQTSLNGVSAVASLALSTANGNEAYAALSVDVANRITAMRINGVDRSIAFLADYFSITPGGTDGVFFDGPAGRFKVVKSGQKVVLAANSGVTLWAGPTSIADGSEVYNNGTLGVGSAGAWFGGQTLSAPFDSGEASASLGLTSSFQDITPAISKQVLNGYFALWPEFTYQGNGTFDGGAGVYRLSIEYRILSTDPSGTSAQQIGGGTVGRTSTTSASFAPLGFAPLLAAGSSIAGTESGERRLVIQARIATGTSAAVTNRRLRGFYAT